MAKNATVSVEVQRGHVSDVKADSVADPSLRNIQLVLKAEKVFATDARLGTCLAFSIIELF